jgi:DNA replication protein DnaC
MPNPNRHTELAAMLRSLKLSTMANSFADVAMKAARENLTHEVFLYELALLECEQRAHNRTNRRLHQSNLVFSEWERIFKDPMTTLAAIDRVVHHSVILDMLSVESYRAKQAQAGQQPPPSPNPSDTDEGKTDDGENDPPATHAIPK